MPDAIRTRAARAIDEKVFPGCVVGVVRATGNSWVEAYGALTYAGTQPVTADTVYDVASVTKSIPVASLALRLIGQEKLARTDLVRTYIPELRNDHAATIEDLLRYRVIGIPMAELSDYSVRDITHCLLQAGFSDLPGKSRYSNLPAFLLGLILERITGKDLEALAHETFFEPLGMGATTFFPDDSVSIIAPSEIQKGIEICGIVHDESARVFAREGKAVGHAGLFSTCGDMLLFLRALLQGEFPEIVNGAQKGLGWSLNEGYFMGKHFGPRTFGKTGFTGSSIVCDADRGVGIAILSNRTYPQRPADAMSPGSAVNLFRRDITDIVFESLKQA